ncbi:MAG: metalloregulator ArsR/SmtB family transcription factor [Bryobacteraceae bacterium]|nr:metalloregulator ArsR/SmtB family transcription factor [Bryobacteraceae bacterium]
MPSILKALKLLADPLRLRILLILQQEELSVAELQDILSMGQSRISTHLAQLKNAELLEDRRSGKHILYRLKADIVPAILELVAESARELPEAEQDRRALELALRQRADKTRAYFDELAGRFGRQYVPGRSWKGLAETLLMLMPPLVVADLGAGEGTFSQLLARRAQKVIAIDNSEKMVQFGSELARRNELTNIEYRVGDIESPPIADSSVDLAFFSQALHHAAHPQRAVDQAMRILKPGGRIVILDLKRHSFEEARELYADLWLGFSEVELDGFLRSAGFVLIEVTPVHREEESPHFETLLAMGEKPLYSGN